MFMKFIAETFEFTEETQFPKTKDLLNNLSITNQL